MTRHVVDYDMVAHLWAHQSQDNARNGHNTFSFSGRKLYSYSTVIARIVGDAEDGLPVVLHTNGSWSVTTSKQQSIARRATNHMKSFTVPDVGDHGEPSHTRNVTYFIGLYDAEVTRLRGLGWKRFVRDSYLPADTTDTVIGFYINPLSGLYADARDYAETFAWELPTRDPVADMLSIQAEQRAKCTPKALAKYRDELETREAAKAVARRADEERFRVYEASWNARYARENAEKLVEWRAGANVHAGLPDGTVALRRRGDRLETSMGAQVPWSHAVRVFQACMKVRAAGRNILPVAMRVGDFHVNEIKADGSFTAGCHQIGWPEIERLAIEQDVMPVDAPEVAWASAMWPQMAQW